MSTHVTALVLGAGQGERLGEHLPKAFVLLDEQPILVHAVRGLLDSGLVDQIIVLVPEDLTTTANQILTTAQLPMQCIQVVAGGILRSDSVRVGLEYIGQAEYVLIHDAARALTPSQIIDRLLAALQAGHEVVVPTLSVVDTIKSVDMSGQVTATLDRDVLVSVQTPQAFTQETALRAYAGIADASDDAGLAERLGIPVHCVPGDRYSFKITTQLDLFLARALLAHDDQLQRMTNTYE